jgi:hypothetical protein
MATVEQQIEELDVVSLLRAHGRWPKGCEGTVVDDYGSVKLIEIANDLGQTLDLIEVPVDQLKLIYKCPRLAGGLPAGHS